jgi:phosphoribosylformimino-5-aminoimidazole carboxamide ribotide isomerase
MIVYPAIDMRGGRCVRLRQGDFGAETVFANDPAEAARRWVDDGAAWLHVVNLDGALGAPGASADNLAALERILRVAPVPVQFGGGVRSLDDVARLLDLGVARVILGTVAVRRPEVVAEAVARHGAERVAVGIDARDGRVTVQGWTETAAVTATDLARRVAEQGVRHVVYTDVRRDGMLVGVNVAATAALAQASGLQVIASGGVASLDDVRALRARAEDGIAGVIIGMALYRGAFSLPDAIAAARCGA